MTLSVISFEKTVAIAIPLATFAALAASVFIYAKTKGTQDALRNTIQTWKDLAEARKEALEEEEFTSKELREENKKLKRELREQKRGLCIAIDELIKGFSRAGVQLPHPQKEICKEEGE